MNFSLTRVHLEIAGAVLGVAIAGLLLHEHDQRIQQQAVAEATQKAQDALQKQYQQQISDIQKQEADREAAYEAKTNDLNAKFADASKSTAQMAALISQLEKLPTPITVTTPPPTAENPHPQPVVTVPPEDFAAAQTYHQQCEQCKLDRDKALADVADRTQQMALAQKTIDSLKTQRDAALVAARGGSVWHRALKAIKYVAIGAAIGYVAARH